MPAGAYNKAGAFGPGFLSVLPGVGWNGVAALDSLTPLRFAVLQSVDLDFEIKLKELYGQSVYPIVQGASTGKISGKIKLATFSGQLLASLIWGSPTSVSGIGVSLDTAHVVPLSTPYTITITGATTDLGVFYNPASTPQGSFGKQFSSVATPTTAATYSFNAATGVYTFEAADAGANILITYESAASTSSSLWTIPNVISGQPPTFQVNFCGFWNGTNYLFTFPYCNSSKLTFGSKLNDFIIPEIDFSVVSNTEMGGTMGTASILT